MLPGHPGHLTSSNPPWPSGWAPQGLGEVFPPVLREEDRRTSQQAPFLSIAGLKSSPSQTSHHTEAEDPSFPGGPQAHPVTSVALRFPIRTVGGEGNFYLSSLLCAKPWFSALPTLTPSISRRP